VIIACQSDVLTIVDVIQSPERRARRRRNSVGSCAIERSGCGCSSSAAPDPTRSSRGSHTARLEADLRAAMRESVHPF